MARNDDGQRIARARSRNGSRRGRLPDAARNLRIRTHFSVRYSLQVRPYALLKCRRANVRRQIDVRLRSGKMRAQRIRPRSELRIARFPHRPYVGIFELSPKQRFQFGFAFAELHETQAAVGRSQHQQPDRCVHTGKVYGDAVPRATVLGRRHSQARASPFVDAARGAVAGIECRVRDIARGFELAFQRVQTQSIEILLWRNADYCLERALEMKAAHAGLPRERFEMERIVAVILDKAADRMHALGYKIARF